MSQSPRIARAQVRRLRERDGDDCWLCSCPIDFGIKDQNDPMHYSRDHVIPASAGGPGTMANLRLAHRVCNTARGSRPPGWERCGDVAWDDRMSARQPAGGRVLYLGEEPSLLCG